MLKIVPSNLTASTKTRLNYCYFVQEAILTYFNRSRGEELPKQYIPSKPIILFKVSEYPKLSKIYKELNRFYRIEYYNTLFRKLPRILLL